MRRANTAGELRSSNFIERPDSVLVDASKGGEAWAFGVLVERYNAAIFSVVFRITRNRQDTEDIVQQSFQKALVHLQSFQGRASFSTWLTRIAINEALMWARKKRALSEVALESMRSESDTASFLEIPDAGASPEEIFALEEKSRILWSAMNRLTPGLRKALRLQLEERTIRETARILGMPIGTIKARLSRARKRLRKQLMPLRQPRGNLQGALCDLLL